MATLTAYWHHEAFSRDAGMRSNEDTDTTDRDSVQTGVLTDEHQDVIDGRPVLVEDVTERVYRAEDLPPDTRVVVQQVTVERPVDSSSDVLEKARAAGFEVAISDR